MSHFISLLRKRIVRLSARRFASKVVAAFAVLCGVVVGCNIPGQPCGLLNLSACSSGQANDGDGGGDACGVLGMGGAGGMGGNYGGSSAFGGSGVGIGVGGSGVAVGVGGSDVGSSGAGGFGEKGPSTPEPQDGCSSDDQGPVEEGLKVFCTQPDWGTTCAARCATKGLACGSIASHPYKSNAGLGQLFSCNDPLFGMMCGYHYPNGDDCYYYFGFPTPPFCSYSGND